MTRYRWVVAWLLFAVGMLTYLDRTALSIVAPIVRKEFHLDNAQMGMIFSAFFVGYSVFCFIGGWAADRFGPRKVFALAAATWSLFCGATAFCHSVAHLVAVRVMFGVGEGPMGTTTNKSIANWFPRRETGRAVGFTNAGQPLGAALASPVVGAITVVAGWRVSFMVIGAIGFAWVAVWWLCFRDLPDQHSKVDSAEAGYIASDRGEYELAHDLSAQGSGPRHVFRFIFSAPVQGVAAAFFCFNYVQYFFLTWLPSYLMDAQHLDVKHMSIISVIPWLGAALGFVLGGLCSDGLYRFSGSVLFARKAIIAVGLSVAAVAVLLAARVHTPYPAVALIAVSTLFAFMAPQACWSLLQDIVPGEHLGVTGGFVHFVANIAGVCSPGITGLLIQYGGGYASAFALTSAIAAAGVVAMLALVRRNKLVGLREGFS